MKIKHNIPGAFESSLLVSAFEELSTGILVLKRDGEILFSNRECGRLLGNPQVGAYFADVRANFLSETGTSLPGEQHPVYQAIDSQKFGTTRVRVAQPGGAAVVVDCITAGFMPADQTQPAVIVELLDRSAVISNEVSLNKRVDELLVENERLKKLATYDTLTEVKNRNYLNLILAGKLERSITTQESLSLLLIDIDFFKRYNDRYGHLKGDECLAEVAGIIKSQVNPEHLARFGGEEFCVLLPGKDIEAAGQIAEKIRIAVHAARLVHDKSPFGFVTVSVGASSLLHLNTKTPGGLLQTADYALYQAKNRGRNQSQIYAGNGLKQAS